VQCW